MCAQQCYRAHPSPAPSRGTLPRFAPARPLNRSTQPLRPTAPLHLFHSPLPPPSMAADIKKQNVKLTVKDEELLELVTAQAKIAPQVVGSGLGLAGQGRE